jgi:hypothetical protein
MPVQFDFKKMKPINFSLEQAAQACGVAEPSPLAMSKAKAVREIWGHLTQQPDKWRWNRSLEQQEQKRALKMA